MFRGLGCRVEDLGQNVGLRASGSRDSKRRLGVFTLGFQWHSLGSLGCGVQGLEFRFRI